VPHLSNPIEHAISPACKATTSRCTVNWP
jgi:hypothetical protein